MSGPVAAVLIAALVLAGIPAEAPGQSAAPEAAHAAQSVQAGQSAAPTSPSPANGSTDHSAEAPAARSIEKVKPPTSSERRRAAKLYMQAAELYKNQQFEKALAMDVEAAKLDPTNPDYSMAAEIARSHAVTALMQDAAHDTTQSNRPAARAALSRALDLDPQNQLVIDHIRGLADSTPGEQESAEAPLKTPQLAPPLEIHPRSEKHSFHLNTSVRQIIPAVYSAYGVDATVDPSVRSQRARFDMDDATYAEATRALNILTGSFSVPIDVHRVLVLRDSTTNRMEFEHNALDTVNLAGLSQNDMTDMGNVARNVFELRQINVDASAGTLTVRGPVDTVNAFRSTYQDLLAGPSEVQLDVRLLQIAHTSGLNTGVQPPQTLTAFNVYAEEQQILQQNASLVQQIISSGLVAPGDTLAILGILIASGAVPSSLFSNGLLVFGGGLTQTALTPNSGFTVNLNLNSSDSRELDNYRIRLQDGEEGTLKSGTRYPIMTSSFSNLGTSGINIPGLNAAGTSAGLAGLLSNSNLASENIPQFQYQDLGLVLKSRPRVLRSGDVAMTLDMKITALAGSALNGVPVLANRSYQGAVTVPANQAVVLAAEIDKTESRAISGYPGLSEVPGFNDITSKEINQNFATLLIVITPHVVRNSHPAGGTPQLRVAKTPTNR